MSKRTVFTSITPLPAHISRAVVLSFLHSYEDMIDLNPLVKDRHPIEPPADADAEEAKCVWYSLTDKIVYLPGGLAEGDVSYTAVFNRLPNGLQTHCRAPMGVDIREKWTLNGSLPGEPPEPVELGLGAPQTGLYIREDVDLRCNVLMAGFVKKTLKKSHATLVERMAARAQNATATATAAALAAFEDLAGARSHSQPPPAGRPAAFTPPPQSGATDYRRQQQQQQQRHPYASATPPPAYHQPAAPYQQQFKQQQDFGRPGGGGGGGGGGAFNEKTAAMGAMVPPAFRPGSQEGRLPAQPLDYFHQTGGGPPPLHSSPPRQQQQQQQQGYPPAMMRPSSRGSTNSNSGGGGGVHNPYPAPLRFSKQQQEMYPGGGGGGMGHARTPSWQQQQQQGWRPPPQGHGQTQTHSEYPMMNPYEGGDPYQRQQQQQQQQQQQSGLHPQPLRMGSGPVPVPVQGPGAASLSGPFIAELE